MISRTSLSRRRHIAGLPTAERVGLRGGAAAGGSALRQALFQARQLLLRCRHFRSKRVVGCMHGYSPLLEQTYQLHLR